MSQPQAKLSKLWVVLVASLLAAATMAACDGDGSPGVDGGGGAGGTVDGGHGGEGAGGSGGSMTPPGVTGGGLELTIDAVTVSDTGVATVDFSITDADGHPLDLDGYLTAGAVSPRFILSWLGENSKGESTQYTAYTLRTVDGPDGKPVKQSSYDSGGTYTTLDLGKYRYQFATVIDISAERKGLTHTLGAYATRQLADTKFVATALKSWVPAGGSVKTKLDVVNDTACNSCHVRLQAHGGSRRGVEMCQLCHTESNSLEPISGNTIDFQVMIHKIHRGSSLPSVKGGEPYVFGDGKDDFSDVAFPSKMQDCTKCHQGSQGDRWLTRPAEKPCTSCHDRTYFGSGSPPAGWTAHSGGPRDDSECITCHAKDSIYPINAMHLHVHSQDVNPTDAAPGDAPAVVAQLISITNAGPNQAPIVKFSLTRDGTPVDVTAAPQAMNRLGFRAYGPNDESAAIAGISQGIVTDGGTLAVPVCVDPLVPPCLEKDGPDMVLHMSTVVPTTAIASWTGALEGNVLWSPKQPTQPTSIKVSFPNAFLAFAVTDATAEARRQVVTVEACNRCHTDLGYIEHHMSDVVNFPDNAATYNDPTFCISCHRPGRFSNSTGQSINLKDMVHRIHSEARYPAPLNYCQQCHDAETYYVPLSPGLLPSATSTYTILPEGAACTGCHSDAATLAHAQTNSTATAEACGTCHGDGKDQSVAKVHAMSP